MIMCQQRLLLYCRGNIWWICILYCVRSAYLSLVRPTLSYASAAWDPYTLRNINKLEMIQRRAVRFVYNRYTSRDSVTALQKDLNWPSLTILRKRDRLCTMYKILNNLAAINSTKLPLVLYLCYQTQEWLKT